MDKIIIERWNFMNRDKMTAKEIALASSNNYIRIFFDINYSTKTGTFNYVFIDMESENDIIELLENKKLSVDDLNPLLDLMMERGNLLTSNSPDAAKVEYHKCLIIIGLIEKNATNYDLNLVYKKREIEAKV